MLGGEAMKTLRQLVDINSYSGNFRGLEQVAMLIVATAQRHHLPMDSIPAAKDSPIPFHLIYDGTSNSHEPFFGILGHFDTVHRPNSAFKHLNEDGERLYGPGIFDMKSGIVTALYALSVVKKLEGTDKIPIKVIFNCDEETGSRSSRLLVEQEMKGASGVFVFEGRNRRDHALVTARKGILMGAVKVEGIAAHAGKDPEKGANAIVEAAHKILQLDRLTDHRTGTVVTTGKIVGGEVANQIPASCRTEIDIRFRTSEEKEKIQRKVADIMAISTVRGTSTVYDLVCARPSFSMSTGSEALLDLYRQAATEFDIAIAKRESGGGSDANFTAAMGVPTLDGLGPEGGGAHTDKEYIVKKSLVDSIRIFALFFSRLIYSKKRRKP